MAKQPPGSGRGMSTRLKTAEGRSTASQRWLTRQLNDPYVKAAKERGLRSRAAFKLLEMDEKLKMLKPGAAGGRPRRGAGGLDAGGGAGGGPRAGRSWPSTSCRWTRCRAPPSCRATSRRRRRRQRTIGAMGGRADLVLSDMAPNTTGHQATDHLRIMALAEIALEFALPGAGAAAAAFIARCCRAGRRPRCWRR